MRIEFWRVSSSAAGLYLLPWSLSSWPTFAQRERKKKSVIPLGMTERENPPSCGGRKQRAPLKPQGAAPRSAF